MTPEILIIIQTIVTASATIAYILTYRYMSKKVKEMEQTVTTMKTLIDSQTQIIQNVDSYIKIYNPKDFEEAMIVKLDNQQAALNKQFDVQKKEIADNIAKSMAERFTEANADLLGMVQELIQFPVHMTVKQFPDKKQKIEKDVFIRQHYPYCADKLIAFTDAVIAGQIQPNDQSE